MKEVETTDKTVPLSKSDLVTYACDSSVRFGLMAFLAELRKRYIFYLALMRYTVTIQVGRRPDA